MMKYRTLGKTGLSVGVIGMGTWQFGGEWGKDFTQDEATAMFRKALELGINFIDTAECYGDHLSERFIGNALREIGGDARSRFILATKFGHHFVKPFERTEPRSGADIQKQLDDSLAALQTDYIDLYQYHSWGDAQFFNEEVRGVIEKARAAGKIRHVGNSISQNNASTAQVERAEEYHSEALQVVYNRLTRGPEERLFPICQRLGLGVLARVPLASGFLSGKYKPGATFAANDVRAHWGPKDADERLREVERIGQAEVPAGVPMAQWALAWCLRSSAVQCVIPGCKNVQQVEDNARAAELVEADHPWAVRGT